MNFTEELTMLVGLILVLGLAYMGVTFWSKRPVAPGAAGGGGAGGADGTGSNAVADMALDELEENEPKRPVDRQTNLKERFKLSGKDAEVAAKVLKRMLKQGKDSRSE
jgi:hypothetical protein